MTDVLPDYEKRLNGQFFTIYNPFNNDLFFKWMKAAGGLDGKRLIEPFAGANNIVLMMEELGIKGQWGCYDVAPESQLENKTELDIELRDTLKNYPQGYDAAITNPPYLAKNSAKRRGMPYPETSYDDLYKLSLDVMLANTPYVAAIIPESFIVQDLFHDRLFGVISLTCKMFDDTDCPVCLALFVPNEQKEAPDDFVIYSGNTKIGMYQDLKKYITPFKGQVQTWRFNDPEGEIGLMAIDNTLQASISFMPGEDIAPEKVKHTSRSITRIGGFDGDKDELEAVIIEVNRLMSERRCHTKDVFMTSFKGLRKDGKYRRRLDFAQARDLLNQAVANVRCLEIEAAE